MISYGEVDTECLTTSQVGNKKGLSKGNVLNRVFELREELKIFLDIQDKETFFSVTYFGNQD